MDAYYGAQHSPPEFANYFRRAKWLLLLSSNAYSGRCGRQADIRDFISASWGESSDDDTFVVDAAIELYHLCQVQCKTYILRLNTTSCVFLQITPL